MVSLLDAAEIAGAVELVQTATGKFGQVPDVVHPRCRFEQLGILA